MFVHSPFAPKYQSRISWQGTADNFYKQGQLLPENFVAAAREAERDENQVNVRPQDGYDHSYFFVCDGYCL